MKQMLLLVLILCFGSELVAQLRLQTDVLVVGGTTGGTASGIQSARSGAKTIIVEQTHWLGGMLTAAGVSCTDGNNALPGGIWEEFRQALYTHYGTKNLAAGWVSETCFEPHVGDSIFKAWAAKEKNLRVYFGWYFDHAIMIGNRVTGASFINSRGEQLKVEAKVTIDASDLGDVFASAGAGYDLGTEDSLQSGEKIAPGRSKIIQDITWAATLKDFGKGADKTIARPQDYDPALYYCSTSDAPCNGKPYPMNTLKVLDYGKLRVAKGSSGKYMLNWPAHGNDYYLDVVGMKPMDRGREYDKARNRTLGFIYFIQTALGQKNIGLADDEMDRGLAFIPYNREGRRVRGAVRLNIDHIQHPYRYALYRTGIAVGDYPVDHHHAQYPGKPPPIPFPPVPSFNVPLGALIPEKTAGLIVCEKGISVSNIANGTTRLQPVVLLTGQAAGMLAAQTVKQKKEPGKIDVFIIQDELLNHHCYIMPYVDVKPADTAWEAVQRVGAMGLLKGVGKADSWANKTFFYPDSLVTCAEFRNNAMEIDGLSEQVGVPATHQYITLDDLRSWSVHFANKSEDWPALLNALPAHLLPSGSNDPLNRRQVALVLNQVLMKYRGHLEMDINGRLKFLPSNKK